MRGAEKQEGRVCRREFSSGLIRTECFVGSSKSSLQVTKARERRPDEYWATRLFVRSGVSALVVAFLLGYSAHYEWGLSRDIIRFGALLDALIIGMLVVIDGNLRRLK
jgi:hypothetical protein